MVVARKEVSFALIFPIKIICKKFYEKIILFTQGKYQYRLDKNPIASFFQSVFDNPFINIGFKTSFTILHKMVEADLDATYKLKISEYKNEDMLDENQ